MAIKVIAAAYGSKKAGFDVTDVVQKRLDEGNDDVKVSNEAFGDPHRGETKRFGIVYQLVPDGEKHARCATEGETFELID
jgi:hypothetical protein